MGDTTSEPHTGSASESGSAAAGASAQSGEGNLQFGDNAQITGDVFAGGKREINTQGGDYFEKIENLYQAAPTGVAARFQLPAAPPDFTGRTTELDELRAAASAGAVIFGLRGQGGVGKTALALVLAHELAPQYPDVQIYLDLLGTTKPLAPGAVMAHALRAFAPTAQLPDNDAGLAAAYRSVLHGQRALLFFDNAANAEQVTPLLPPPGCLLLVTSRQRFSLPGLKGLNLERLPRQDATQLLRAIAPGIGEHAEGIAALCGDLPQALRLAGGALAENDDLTPDAYLAMLATEQGRMKELEPVMASLALSYALLPPDLQAAWRALAVFVGGFDRAAAAAVLGLEADTAAERLRPLLRYSLLEYDRDVERHRLPDLARDAAGARLVGNERLGVERRHAAHYRNVLAAIDELYLEGGAKALVGLGLFDQERPNIEAGQAWAAAHGEHDDEAARLLADYPNAGVYVLALRQHPRERIAWLEMALAAARRLGDKGYEGAHLASLGLAYARLGQPRCAIEFHEQALVLARKIGDRPGEWQSLGNLGNAYKDLGDARRAIELQEQALVMAREMGDRRGEGAALDNLGMAFTDLGQPRRAIEFHEQALVLAREVGNRAGEGHSLGRLGNAYADLSEPRRAMEFYEQQLVIMREIGDRRGEGNALGNLGLTYYELGQPHRATEFFEQQLVIAREISDRRGEGNALSALGHAYVGFSQPRRAIEYYEQDLGITREIGDRRNEGVTLGNLGVAYNVLGEPRRAIEFFEQALVIAREIGDRRGEGNALGNLGNAYYALGEPRRAIQSFEQALVIEHEIGDRRGEGHTLWNMSWALEKLGQRAEAIAKADLALHIYEQIEDPNAEQVRRQLSTWKGEGGAPGGEPPG